MDYKEEVKSIVIPKKTIDNFEGKNLKDLFEAIYTKDEEKKIKSFVRDLLQILNAYDFEYIKFIKDENILEYKCYLSEYEIFKISTLGFILYIDPLPLSPDLKKELIFVTDQNDQSPSYLKKEYDTNATLVFCNPDNIENLQIEFIKGFRYLISHLMDNSFSTIEYEHDLDFLKYFELEFLLEINESQNEFKNNTDQINSLLEGETSIIEYKSSIFWSDRLTNYKIPKESKLSNISQNEILRTINGFMNSRGGTLIIGLHDKHKENQTNQNVVRKDFQEEYYDYPDFDRYLLKITELLRHGFGSVSMQLCQVELINLGPGVVFDENIIPSSKKNFHEKFVNFEKDRMLLKISVSESNIPVFVNLKAEICRNHDCDNCLGTSTSSRFNIANNTGAYFVRSAGSSTEQYSFDKIIEHISIKYPKYFKFISDNNHSEINL